MFIMHMPENFKIGHSADCRINGEPTRLTWRDQNALVIGEHDARTIVTTHIENGLRCFICGDADNTQYGVEHAPGGEGFIVSAKPDNKR